MYHDVLNCTSLRPIFTTAGIEYLRRKAGEGGAGVAGAAALQGQPAGPWHAAGAIHVDEGHGGYGNRADDMGAAGDDDSDSARESDSDDDREEGTGGGGMPARGEGEDGVSGAVSDEEGDEISEGSDDNTNNGRTETDDAAAGASSRPLGNITNTSSLRLPQKRPAAPADAPPVEILTTRAGRTPKPNPRYEEER